MAAASWEMFKFVAVGVAIVQSMRKSCYTVQGGHRAVEFNRLFGTKNKVYKEGTHWKFPFLEWSTIYDVRARPHLFKGTAGTNDLQMVEIDVRILAHPEAADLPALHRTVGEKYDEVLFPSLVQETLRSVVSQYNASQLVTQRETVSKDIRTMLTEKAGSFHIAVEDVSVTNIAFSKEFTAAIEAKQVAAQEIEQAKYIVEKAEQDKKSAILRAQGEAKSAALIGEAIGENQSFITLRKIEASREIAKILAESQNRVILNADDLMLNAQGM